MSFHKKVKKIAPRSIIVRETKGINAQMTAVIMEDALASISILKLCHGVILENVVQNGYIIVVIALTYLLEIPAANTTTIAL